MKTLASELERCRPWIESALEHSNGTHLFGDIVAGVAEGNLQLWPASKSCIVTEIVLYPRKKVLNVFLAGGDLLEIKGMRPSVEAWARAQGCSGATLSGRKGWVKALKDHGWRELWATMALEFD